MKNLFLFSAAMFVACAYSCENPKDAENANNTQTELETDPSIVQAHRLKAVESKLAVFHERNSFLDAYMNPTNFTEISETMLRFPHYKYPEVTYNLSWDSALKNLNEAEQECAKLVKDSSPNIQHPLIENISNNPTKRFDEKEKYTLQLLFFAAYREYEDLDSNDAKVNIILNRSCFAHAFKKKCDKKVAEYSMTELRTKPFENLTDRIKGLRFLAAMRMSNQLGMASFVLGGVASRTNGDCIIS